MPPVAMPVPDLPRSHRRSPAEARLDGVEFEPSPLQPCAAPGAVDTTRCRFNTADQRNSARPQEGDSWQNLQLTANLTRPGEHIGGGNDPETTELSRLHAAPDLAAIKREGTL